MNAITFLAILAVLWCLKDIALTVLIRRRIAYVNHMLRVEITQRHFAEARNQLVSLALESKIDVKSETFKILYRLNTGIMRRPDAYPEISRMLRFTFLRERNSEVNLLLNQESRKWSNEIRKVVISTANAMGFLGVNYSWLMRIFYRLEKRVDPSATHWSALRSLGASSPEKASVVKEIREAQKEMYRLAESQ